LNILNANVAAVNKKIREAGVKGEVYEFEAELQPRHAAEMGFRLRKNVNAETLVGFNRTRSEVFVDRTRSGEISFSKDFPGRHTAKLGPQASIKLHVFVDRSSIEVFSNDGEAVISDRIYPPQGSDGIELYETKTGGAVVSLTIWDLDSIWSRRAH
jgi:fructan beta-fructosidase